MRRSCSRRPSWSVTGVPAAAAAAPAAEPPGRGRTMLRTMGITRSVMEAAGLKKQHRLLRVYPAPPREPHKSLLLQGLFDYFVPICRLSTDLLVDFCAGLDHQL